MTTGRGERGSNGSELGAGDIGGIIDDDDNDAPLATSTSLEIEVAVAVVGTVEERAMNANVAANGNDTNRTKRDKKDAEMVTVDDTKSGMNEAATTHHVVASKIATVCIMRLHLAFDAAIDDDTGTDDDDDDTSAT